MSTWTPIDLSQLPEPAVVETLDYEVILAERKAYLIGLWPAAEQARLRQQLRALLHYHCGGNTLRTRQLMLEVQRLKSPMAFS